ncbi:MAG: Lpg1974 family pore-forming outer membrane protein, partial [Rhodospirillales bacterium]
MNKIFRTALFAGTAMAAIATGMPQEAAAQSQNPGFFGSLSGWYYFNSGRNPETNFQKNHTIQDPLNHPKGGPGGKLHLGYRFMGSLDLAMGVQGTWLGTRRLGSVGRGIDSLKSSGHYWAVDGELGYNTNVAGLGVRLFVGPRFARFSHDNKIGGFVDGLGGAFFKNIDQVYTGIGPRIGTDFSARIGNSNFSIFGDMAAALLFGKLKHEFSVSSPPCESDCSGSESNSRRVWNLEGQLGLGYEISPGITLGAGYRAEYWRHVAESSSHVSRVMHGPFVRIAYNFGAPPLAPMAAMVPPPPPAPAPMAAKSFIVFFDFDRSNITAA